MKSTPKIVIGLTWIMIVLDAVIFVVHLNFHDRYWDAMDYITNLGDQPPHSLYSMHRFETPYYSWLH
jgi:hypothetical protein